MSHLAWLHIRRRQAADQYNRLVQYFPDSSLRERYWSLYRDRNTALTSYKDV